MVALKTSEIEKFLARPDPGRPIILVFGADAGLARERAEALIHSAIDDPKDPFQLVRLEGDDLASESHRLVEEANTIPLFGGRRAVWVKAGGRNFVAAVEALIACPSPDCRVVIEAGDLRKTSPVRAACERAKNAVTLQCYADTDRDIVRLIDDEMRTEGLTISPEARSALVPLLGGDRLASRHEVRKLALYARGKPRVELDDVMAVVADASTLALDGMVDAAFAGKTGELEVQLGKARIAGTSAGTIVSTALRQVAQLHKARLAVDQGVSVGDAAGGIQPFLHFSRRAAVEAALKAWSSARLERAMSQLAEATLETRKQTGLADVIAERALLAIAVNARRRD